MIDVYGCWLLGVTQKHNVDPETKALFSRCQAARQSKVSATRVGITIIATASIASCDNQTTTQCDNQTNNQLHRNVNPMFKMKSHVHVTVHAWVHINVTGESENKSEGADKYEKDYEEDYTHE